MFYSQEDIRRASKGAKGTLLVPFPIPRVPPRVHSNASYISSVEWNGWSAWVRLCTISGTPSGGAVLRLTKGGITLTNRIKCGRVCTHSLTNSFKRMAQVILRLASLVRYRAEAQDAVDSYVNGLREGSTEQRLAIARLIKLARKAQRDSGGVSSGIEASCYDSWTTQTCERVIDAVAHMKAEGYHVREGGRS